MPSVWGSAKLIRLGPFELDLRAVDLRKYGLRVKLQERPFQILCLLLEDRGAVVSREALKAKLWKSGRFVDFDHGISSAVNKLRAALGDSAESPRYVETIGRQGYRFIAEISIAEPPQKTAAQSAPSKPSEIEQFFSGRREVVWRRPPPHPRPGFAASALGLPAGSRLSAHAAPQPADAPRV